MRPDTFTEQVSDKRPGWLARRWGRLATGPKMLLIMAFGLLPLGFIALFASYLNARDNSAERAEQTLLRLDEKAERLNELLTRSETSMRAADAALVTYPADPQVCAVVLRSLVRLQPATGRYMLFGQKGAPPCATPGFVPARLARGDPVGRAVEISPDGQRLRLTLFDERGEAEGVAEFSRSALRQLTFLPGTRADFNLELVGGGRRMLVREDYRPVPFVQTVSDTAPIGEGRLQLRIRVGSVPIRALDVLLILLPVMMWVAAAMMAWWIVNRNLLKPLAKIQEVVSSYRPGDRPIELPRLRSPAREIGELGQAFDHVTRTVASHEAELEAAVERQSRLVREVHHRVKNNLQVVASLLNLHSRGSPNEEAAGAYASIQRRVDALAVVHRNHYAQFEESRGIALRGLVSELAANLRATAPPEAAMVQIRLDVAPLHVTQDVAVSVAFLITEITEYAMLRGTREVTIVVRRLGPGTGRLAIEADGLAGDAQHGGMLSDRFDRIIVGLSRQLRSTLERDNERGHYAVTLPITEAG